MNAKIMILNYSKNEKVDNPYTSIELVFLDFEETKFFVGSKPVTFYVSGVGCFNKLSKGLLHRPLMGKFEFKENMYKPKEVTKCLVAINDIEL